MSAQFRFLVIDDDADTRFLHRHVLSKAFPGCIVVEADSTDSALAAATAVPIDAVISDHHLAGEEGTTCIRSLHAQGVTCPIVMVTSSVDPAVHRAAYAAGVNRVFSDVDADIVSYLRSVL